MRDTADITPPPIVISAPTMIQVSGTWGIDKLTPKRREQATPGNCQVNWIRSPVWVPPRSEKAQIIAAYELAPTKLIATDGKFSELSINLSIPRE